MRTSLIPLLLLSLSAPAAARDCPAGLSLARALFSAEIRDRQPVSVLEQLPRQRPAVYFFTRVLGGAGATITHVWSYGGEEVVPVPLRVGGDDWRTWSSKNLGLRRQQDWTVTVLGPDGCRLGEYRLPAGTGPGPEQTALLEKIRTMIDAGDLSGAQLEIKTALAGEPGPEMREHLQGLLSRDLVLARISREIDQQALYTARSRLQALLEMPLDEEQQRRARLLQQHLRQNARRLDHQASARLADLEAALEASLAGGRDCRHLAGELENLLSSLLGPEQPFLVTERQQAGNELIAGFLDRRTGEHHEVAISCLRLSFPGHPD